MPGITTVVSEFCRLVISPPIDDVVSMLKNTSICFTSVVNVSCLVCEPAGSL